MPDAPGGSRCIVAGPLRAWVAPGVDLARDVAPDGDPDGLLTSPRCHVIKLQRKVVVGRVETAGGWLYVKRYSVFAPRVAAASVFASSPAVRAWNAAHALAALGFAIPAVVAAVEFRRFGLLRRSFLITREVPDAVTADARYREILADPHPVRRHLARRALARALGALFRQLHACGVYHGDLKDVNVLVRGPAEAPECVLLDLERVRVQREVTRQQRVKNLVQLERTLGRSATATDRLRMLHAYLGAEATRATRRAWARQVLHAAAAKDRAKGDAPPARTAPRVSCTIVCQDEEEQVSACLASVAWCDEIVMVDGGSRDRTVDLARRFTDRILFHPWPGYRAQKQFALEAASGDWVLNIDADERVTSELADEIRTVLPHTSRAVRGYAIPRLVPYLGRWWYRGGWYPRRIVRLLRREGARWGGVDPHERALVSGRVVPLENPILHYTYRDIADHLHTVNKLTAVAAEQIPAQRRVGAFRLVAEPWWRFVRSYLIKRGALEGVPGFFVAATDAFYVFLRWARVWQRTNP